MRTLHIEHPITDLETWVAAFNRFDDARREAAVRAERRPAAGRQPELRGDRP
jgi:hypothetical protein